MSSIYIDEVRKFLEEELGFGENDISFESMNLGGGETRVYCRFKNHHGCDNVYWDEFLVGGSCVDMLHCRMAGSKKEKLEFLKKQLGNIISGSGIIEQRKQLVELREENERLKAYISRLRDKKRELKYTPGNRGALETQQHFQSLFQ